jgi:hypothetical protein
MTMLATPTQHHRTSHETNTDEEQHAGKHINLRGHLYPRRTKDLQGESNQRTSIKESDNEVVDR